MHLAGLIIAAAAMLVPAVGQAQAVATSESAPGARLLAAGCAGCHGTDGRLPIGGSKLAGLDEAFIVAQLKAFRSGTRSATVMHQLAKGYGDAEIAILARHFATQGR